MEGHVLNTTPLKQHLLQIPRQQSYVMTVMLQRPPKRVASPQGASAPRLFSHQLSDEAGATVDQAGSAPASALAPQEQQLIETEQMMQNMMKFWKPFDVTVARSWRMHGPDAAESGLRGRWSQPRSSLPTGR